MKVTMITGDGIGEEIAQSAMDVIDASGADIAWDIVRAGEAVYEETGVLIPDKVYESLEQNKVALKAPMTTPIGKGFRSVNVSLRKKYDLYANIRPVQSIGALETLFEKLDLVLFRENTEDLYAGIEEKISEDEMRSIKVITRKSSERIIRRAFAYAKENNRSSVTVVTKANIMKLSDGLFLDIAREIAAEFPTIEFKEILVDNMAMQLVINPYQFDVVVTENLYGDILSDEMAGLIGGLGLVPGANIGDEMAIFEAVHGSAPDIAGKNLANPTAIILGGCMMLDYLDKTKESNNIRHALDVVLSSPENFTHDLKGTATTSQFTRAVIEQVQQQ
ncbi:isocitrate/isopropylmalate dehydrogenase family protein [Tetragenococcus koreensis]|uniref:Isocitrate dehydrogenase n=2 Tax=Tetragenococcus koreensis TaxID=290335 RepID=A0AAN4RK32_9ENTE|nr:isocitrate/isopropylmalate family dehydrogenase [Tetragenococcus koreensis]MCF1621353.1 isocitrate/isopropylmalate family dehydrogenase [Tetragenococcus koreensis]MCF1626397.1 isocitrate/isopropylmalate family dehydrogenase [Tetragenococcus koreensis]MCF1631078.1 isocitrate/isopropylmalate family dehydrogenase [Tetragenococcus koreensis]MCF1677403.1 isocitrate/isopropylmalate family dehydrogenase [Tetragenococcus koreensis]MCF1679726.1 isocitrate/isopropylmalate family dehydrogenase [Tetrag